MKVYFATDGMMCYNDFLFVGGIGLDRCVYLVICGSKKSQICKSTGHGNLNRDNNHSCISANIFTWSLKTFSLPRV